MVGSSGALIAAKDMFLHGAYLLAALWDGGTPIPQLRVPADLNCDGCVNFDDIDPFVLLLTAPDEFAAAYSLCSPLSGGIDGSGTIDFDDIDGFVECLIANGCP